MPLTDDQRGQCLKDMNDKLQGLLANATGLPITIVCNTPQEFAVIAAAIDTVLLMHNDREAMRKEKDRATFVA